MSLNSPAAKNTHPLDPTTPATHATSRQFELLVLDYEQARDDERQLVGAVTTAFSVAVGLLGLLGAAISQAPSIPQLMLAGAPLLPLANIGYMMLMLAQATLRSYYTRGLEAELQRYSSEPITTLGDVPTTSFMRIACEITSLRRGRSGYRLMAVVVQVCVVAVFGGLTLYIGLHFVTSHWLKIAMLAVYAPAAALILWETAAGTIGGRHLFIRTARSFLDGGNPLPRVTGRTKVQGGQSLEKTRSLRSYLIFPRPDDAIKWLYGPAAFICAAWSTSNWRGWGRFLLAWIILEYLIYAARYQWNDLRGIAEDTSHAERKARARLPIGSTASEAHKAVLASLWTAVFRLAMALLLGFLANMILPVVSLIAAVFGIAVIYEMLRAVTRSHAYTDPLKTRPAVVAIWLVVSVGYAVRVSIGFSYGSIPLTSATAILGMTCLAAFGAMVVLLTWVLEATSFCRHDVEELNDPQKKDSQWNELKWYRLNALTEKPHLAALLQFADVSPMPAASAKSLKVVIGSLDDQSYCGRYRILERRGQRRAPWNWALIASCILGSALGVRLSEFDVKRVGLFILVAIIYTLGAVALILCRNTRWRYGIVLCGAGTVIATAAVQSVRLPVIVAVPWFVIGCSYAAFRGSSYRDLKKIGSILKEIPASILGTVVGKTTIETLKSMRAS